MHIKSILSGAAIALAATIGSASAAEQFTTLEGITAAAMTPQELGVVIGAGSGLMFLTLPTKAAAVHAAKGNGPAHKNLGSAKPTGNVKGPDNKTSGIVTFNALAKCL